MTKNAIFITNILEKKDDKRMKKTFPSKGTRIEDVLLHIEPGDNYVSKDRIFLGYPQTVPHSLSVEVLKKYIVFNENHVGTFTNTNIDVNLTRRLERELIEIMGDLYGDNTVDGYVTSGGTEGNIMGVWIGRNFLNNNETCLIKTYLTHQSIQKASNLVGIMDVVDIPYSNVYCMDIDKLKECIEKKISLGITSFIIVATVGYTMTGTMDNVEEIDRLIQRMRIQYNATFYIHVDAAIGGLVYPFISTREFAFSYENVYSISVDPHKMGYIPFSAGLFICRKNMQKYIEIPIKYAKAVMDKTLISSRNASSAVACWAVFNHLGREGFVIQLLSLVKLKEYLVCKLKEEKLARIISDPGTNMVCIHFLNRKKGYLPEQIEKKYVLDGFCLKYKGENILCYKIYIMPHITKEIIDYFVNNIKEVK